MKPTIIKPLLLEQGKSLFSKILFSRTNKVTKVTDGSVMNAIAFGSAKLAQKVNKDISLAHSHFFPDTSYGEYLDNAAQMYGVSPRFQSIGSSTYVRLVGQVGVQYIAGNHTFTGNNGIIFRLDETKVIPQEGFTYAKISSTSTGLITNVDAFSIDQITPIPIGHEYCVNEFKAFGGRDIESDDSFRERLKNANNLSSRSTIELLTQIMMGVNPAVLRCFYYGGNQNGYVDIGVMTENGADLTVNELDELRDAILPYLTMSEQGFGFQNLQSTGGVNLVNVSWFPVDISFRAIYNSLYNIDEVRKELQIKINKYFDYRFWKVGSQVEWDDLLDIVKRQEGIDYVLDNNFFPQSDVTVPIPMLPRVRGFLMLDEDGNFVSGDTINQLDPVFYPSEPDFGYFSTVLANL